MNRRGKRSVLIDNVLSMRERMRLRRKRLREMRIITESGLFDAGWYLNRYPDVASYVGTPLEHFLDYGAAEQRAAGPDFDTRGYVAANPDVASSGINPLVHYIRHGAKEGRGFTPRRPPLARGSGREPREAVDATLSIIIDGGTTAETDATLKSLQAQTYAQFEVILASAAPGLSRTIEALRLGGGAHNAAKVRLTGTTERSRFLREALTLATNEFVVLLDGGDVLTGDALASLSNVLTHGTCDLVYSDESEAGPGSPVALKPSWSPELLTTYNYFGRVTAIRRKVALEALPEDRSFAAAEWELNLRVCERTQAIERLPKVLARRSAAGSERRAALAAPQDHIAVLTDYWVRRGHEARVTARADGTFRSTWAVAEKPLVSIIIPNKNRSHLLRMCSEGLYGRTDYDHFELIVVDNGSTEPETLALYEELQARSARIVDFNEAFNYSRACNLGAQVARGAFLLFLNNDIEVIQGDWLDELVRQAREPGIGIVGPKLLYPDGEIQHAGVALGLFTLAAHVFHRAPQDAWGPIGSPDTQRNWMAVTGACQLIPRPVFDLVGGYDETFEISYSDVVFCMDAARAGFRAVYLPSAVLVHHEGASRGHTNPSNDQVLFARRVRALGIAQDPYFHPALDTQSFAPKLRAGDAPPAGASPMQTDIDRLAGPPASPLDIFDDGAVASAVGLSWDAITWRFDTTHMRPGLEAGARILIEFIRRRPHLRARFPTALSDGAAGSYAAWVKSEGLRLLGLDAETYVPWIEAAFAAGLGSAARQTLIYDEALRRDIPLFLLPTERATACRHLFHALGEETLTLEDLWWFLVSSAEKPLAELCATWAITPAWQREVPDGGTVFGITRLAHWVASAHGVREDWIYGQDYPAIMDDAAQVRLAYAANPDWAEEHPDAMVDAAAARALLRHLATRASGLPFLPRGWIAQRDGEALAEAIVRPGVNILGHFSYPSGLRISTESIVEGLQANAVGVSLRDVPISITTDDPVGHAFNGCEVYGTTVIHVQPEPLFDQAYERAGLRPRAERTYRVGYWYWEFDEVPTSWNRAALDCDELWTATEFIAAGLRKQYRQPVHVFLPGVEIAPFTEKPRAAFGLDADEFVFLFVFHMTSVMERKNPFGLIKAFKQAFKGDERAKLVIKTSFGDKHPEAFASLEAAAADANVVLINRTFSRDETLSLIKACDAYVSLHRSEGLGLSMAEAMLLGRPVVATRYSGNLDFMDDDNSLLVDCRLVTLMRDIPPYKAGQRWAEPSVEHAASQMRRLYDDPAFARSLGARARTDMETRLNYRAAGRAMAARLAEIDAMP